MAEKNPHNKTQARNIFPIEKVHIGKHTYGELKVYFFGGNVERLKIGSYCSIAGDVDFLIGGEHKLDYLSTYPFARHIYRLQDNHNETTKGEIIISDDVWIGHGARILSGVHVGQGAVIGAGTVVAKNVPPYAIFANGRIIRFRFSPEVIEELLKINFQLLSGQAFEEFRKFCTIVINEENVHKIVDIMRMK